MNRQPVLALGLSLSLLVACGKVVPIDSSTPKDAAPPDDASGPTPPKSGQGQSGIVGGEDAGEGDASPPADASSGSVADSSAQAKDSAPAVPEAGQAKLKCYTNTSFTPVSWKGPTPLHQGACTNDQLNAFISSFTTTVGTSGSASCDACLITQESEANWGPVVMQNGEFLEVNWGGCQANLDGDLSASGCGAQTDDTQLCESVECTTCDDEDAGTQCFDEATQDGGPCQKHQETAQCANEWGSSNVVSTCGAISSLVLVWCGS